jgi:4a-hydroxytetrahydrobiopterin dehydratase
MCCAAPATRLIKHVAPLNFPRDPAANLCDQLFMPKLSPSQIKSALASVKLWKKKGATIVRTYQFKDFPAAIKFVNAVGRLAEKAWHHPDIDIRWNKVTLTLTTHDAGGLTKKDFALAKKFDRL